MLIPRSKLSTSTSSIRKIHEDSIQKSTSRHQKSISGPESPVFPSGKNGRLRRPDKIDSNKGSTFSKKFQKKYQCTAHACNSDSSVQSHARAAPPMPDSTPDRNARCTLLTFLEPQAPRAEIDMPGVPSRAATRERCSITISKIITRARLQCVCLCRADWMSWDHDAL